MSLPLIKLNSTGPAVKAWQEFLISQKLLDGGADGNFGPKTQTASVAFQTKNGLTGDGIVGDNTYKAAAKFGFNAAADNPAPAPVPAPKPAPAGKETAAWPPKPKFAPLVSNAAREAVFGKFAYVSAPQPGNPENIRVTDDWKKNIISAPIPQLKKVSKASSIEFHRAAAAQLTKLWADWEQAGLLPLILTWDGSYVARFVRGSKTTLSNHAFGSAFDINVKWNGLGIVPPLAGQHGSVRELVEIANNNGFYWGGHFTRLDGMHFEVAFIV